MQQFPHPYPPHPMPAKKRPPVGWIVVAILAFLGGLFIGIGSHAWQAVAGVPTTQQATSATQVPATTPTAAHVPTWTTTQTFSGNGIKKTAIFTVGDDWKIAYTCTADQFDDVFQVMIYDSTGTLTDIAVNATCKAGQTTSDTTEQHGGGNIYLDMNATGNWTVTISEPK